MKGESTRNGHPAPFPASLAERLIRMFSFAGDTVLDPFLGTGSTSVAAMNTGRNSIGCDIETKYLAIAKSRLKREASKERTSGATTVVFKVENKRRMHLLDTFRGLFHGKVYKHRNSSLGDLVAVEFYEDLVSVGKSTKLVQRIAAHDPVCIGFVGINCAHRYVSWEGQRSYATDGKSEKHPSQEAAEAEARLVALAKPAFDELLIMRFAATNEAPYPFAWDNYQKLLLEYNAVLTRVSRQYDQRF